MHNSKTVKETSDVKSVTPTKAEKKNLETDIVKRAREIN
jgi:hypothetical protein